MKPRCRSDRRLPAWLRGLPALAPVLALTACLATGEDALPSLAPAPVTVSVLEGPPARSEAPPESPPGAAETQPEAAAESPPPSADRVAEPVDPATAACRARGGTMSPGPAGIGQLCVMPTRDAGRPCTRAGDCTGYCLARSQTCAPVTPLLGCHEVLMADGRRMTQCIE